MKPQTERLCSSLSFPVLIIGVVGIPDKAYSRDIRERLLKQVEPLGSERVLKQRNSRRISTRSAQAFPTALLGSVLGARGDSLITGFHTAVLACALACAAASAFAFFLISGRGRK